MVTTSPWLAWECLRALTCSSCPALRGGCNPEVEVSWRPQPSSSASCHAEEKQPQWPPLWRGGSGIWWETPQGVPGRPRGILLEGMWRVQQPGWGKVLGFKRYEQGMAFQRPRELMAACGALLCHAQGQGGKATWCSPGCCRLGDLWGKKGGEAFGQSLSSVCGSLNAFPLSPGILQRFRNREQNMHLLPLLRTESQGTSNKLGVKMSAQAGGQSSPKEE